MPRRPTRPRIETIRTRKLMLEDTHWLLADEPEELAANYGSLEAARARYDFLVESGQYPRQPGQLPLPVWWLTTKDVPDELRLPPAEPDPEILAESGGAGEFALDLALDDTLERDCFRWLTETGRLTDEDRAAIADTASRSPNFRRVVRIAEAVLP